MIDLEAAILMESQSTELMADLNQYAIPERKVSCEEYQLVRDLVEIRMWKIINLLTQRRRMSPRETALLSPEEKILVARINDAVELCRAALLPDPLPIDQTFLKDWV